MYLSTLSQKELTGLILCGVKERSIPKNSGEWRYMSSTALILSKNSFCVYLTFMQLSAKIS